MTINRFTLEEQIGECWQIVEDIRTLESMNASGKDMIAVAAVYEYKFRRLWATFETMVHEGKI